MNSSVRILCFAALGVAASAAFLNVGGKAEGAAGQEAKSAAPANEPVIVVARICPPVALPAMPESQPGQAEDHQLLPSRAPPNLLSSPLVG